MLDEHPKPVAKMLEAKHAWWYADPWGIDVHIDPAVGSPVVSVRIYWRELLRSAVRVKARAFVKRSNLLEYLFTK